MDSVSWVHTHVSGDRWFTAIVTILAAALFGEVEQVDGLVLRKMADVTDCLIDQL